MQIKKYSASSLKEATFLMKSEMGDEAIILSTRVLKNKPMDGERLFEITAGFDNDGTTSLPSIYKSVNAANSEPSFTEELKKVSEKIYQKRTSKIENAYGQAPQKVIASEDESEAIKKKIKDVINNLTDKEVKKTVILSVMDQIKKYKNFLQKDNIENYTKTCLSSLVLTKNFDVTVKKNKVVALVGATGAGKTTTIAKLALIAKIIHKLDVGLISIDTFRLGAIDQLQSFADVGQIDMLVAYKAEDMPGLIKKFSKKDIIFIDTVGRSQNKKSQLKLNHDFLSSIKIDETLLVLSASSSYRNLADIAEKFEMFNYDSFIFSKVDEAVVHGNIINLISKTGIPVSFLTNGQVIPDDIIQADPDYLANLIFTGTL